MEEAETVESGVRDEDKCPDRTEVSCLMRVGKESDWLHLFTNTEISIGRGLDVTYQLLSPTCPLMISRLHCTFKLSEDGHWTVTDKKSLNGVWVNGQRLAPEGTHRLNIGDSIQLGVPLNETKAEFDYTLIQRPLKDIQPFLAKVYGDAAKSATPSKKSKRKLATEEVEPSTSKPKLYRHTTADKSFAHPCPLPQRRGQQRTNDTRTETPGAEDVTDAEQTHNVPADAQDLDNLQMYSQNILLLKEQVVTTQRQVASLEEQPQQADPRREEQVKELQGQLETLRAKMHQMERLEKSFSATKRKLEAKKTQQQDEQLKRQLEEALQEQKKVIDELALSRQDFEKILLAKNKELEVTKEEKEKAKAQKEEVVTQVTEVLENELQCIICSELFIEAVILNCAHSFCCYCINQWRKKKDECPICRQAIQSQNRCLALDNCIDSMVGNLSLDMKVRRQTLVTQRKALDSSPRTVVVSDEDDDDDEDDNSSISSTLSSSMSSTLSSSISSSSSSSSSQSSSLESSLSSVETDSSVHSNDSCGSDELED